MEDKLFDIQQRRAVWVALIRQEKLNEAIRSFEEYRNMLWDLQNDEAISKKIKKELKIGEKTFTEKISVLAEKFSQNKDYSSVIFCYKYLIDSKLDNESILRNYINCLEILELFDVELSVGKYLIAKSDTNENNKLISKIYEQNGDYQNALKYYNRAIEISEKKVLDADDCTHLGCIYFNSYTKKTHEPDEVKNALKYFKKALEYEPYEEVYLKNAIFAAKKARDYETEKKCWKEYFKRGYATAEDEFTYSMYSMRNGDLQTYYKYYDARFRKPKPAVYPAIKQPRWNGEDISDKILLVHYEQGFGDSFLTYGFLPKLLTKAKKVMFYVQNNIYELIKDNEFGIEVYSAKIIKPEQLKFDYHIPSMSIASVLNLSKEELKLKGGYIKANKSLAKQFKENFFQTDKFKIGIAYLGAVNKKRDIPAAKLKLLDKLENVQFYCLTLNVKDEVFKDFKNNKVINIARQFTNFADTAAAIENLDMVFTSDNCILNLAGAMGKKTISVFNYDYEYRWFDLTGEDCGYYPSVKPIINNEYNDWDISINKAVEEIKKVMANKSSS